MHSGRLLIVVSVLLVFAVSPATAAIPQIERDALIDLYNATGGDDWDDRTGWLGPSGTECSWHGVTCGPGEIYVIWIDLHSNGLIGELPSTLADVEYLLKLELWNNPELQGPIPPELGALSHLNSLDLSNCSFSGEIPTAICDSHQLNEILLQGNFLTGGIPSCFWNLPVLRVLDLSWNNLSGELPDPIEIDSLNLSELYLAHNGFRGTIPTDIGDVTTLEKLDLSQNLFSGSLPPSISGLVNLTDLVLSTGRFVGEIPPEITQLTALGTDGLALDDNGLDSTDPLVIAFIDGHQGTRDWPDDQTIPPLDLIQTGATDTSVTLEWTGRGRFGPRTNYEIQVAPLGTGDWRTVDRPPSGEMMNWTVHGLERDSSYHLRLRPITDRRRVQLFFWCDLQPEVVGLFSPEITVSTGPADQSWYVTIDAPPGGDCQSPATACSSIQEAIDLAGERERVVIGPGVYHETLAISKAIHLVGAGSDSTFVDAQGLARGVSVSGGDQVRLESLTIRNGLADDGGGLFVEGDSLVQVADCRIEDSVADRGAGIWVAHGSTLMIEDSRISGCEALDTGGGIANEGTSFLRRSELADNLAPQGGGLAHLDWRVRIYDTIIEDNEAALGGGIYLRDGYQHVERSSVVANRAHHGAGFAIVDDPESGLISFVLVASTVSGNSGGALLASGYSNTCLSDSTIVGNTPSVFEDSGISIWDAPYFYVRNTIIAGNLPLDCNGSVASNGFNIDGDGSCGLDLVTDRSGIDPMLSALGHHGGWTPTHTPLPGSPLIDTGDSRIVSDQTGRDRLVDGNKDGWATPDTGSVEYVGALFFDDFETGNTDRWTGSGGKE